MGGAGDLLSLALNVPPWEDLHELSREELRLTNLVTTDMVALPASPNAAVIELTPKPAHDMCVAKTISEFIARYNRLSWRDGRADLLRSGHAGLATQVEAGRGRSGAQASFWGYVHWKTTRRC